MGAPRKMKPYLVDGIPRPDLDSREVSISLMAFYMGVSADTLRRRCEKNEIKRGMTIRNGYRYFNPQQVLGTLCQATTKI